MYITVFWIDQGRVADPVEVDPVPDPTVKKKADPTLEKHPDPQPWQKEWNPETPCSFRSGRLRKRQDSTENKNICPTL